MDRELKVLIVGDNADAVDPVRQALEPRAGTIEGSLGATALAPDVERARPDVIVFAFDTVVTSNDRYLGLLRDSMVAQTHPHRAVVLCREAEVPEAFALCTDGQFHDYVPYWPQPRDGWRLPMAVHVAAAALRDASVGRRQTILVVDDDTFVSRLIGKALAGALPVEIEFAASATAGLAFLRRMTPALILMDVNMPGMDGVSMTEWLKSTPSLARIPVVMLTGDARRETIERARLAGAADFIVKPFTRESLLSKIAKYVL